MVMVEAMACGTPVIAYPGGSVREVIDDGVTGIIAADIDDAVAAVGRVHELSRQTCRRVFEKRFTAARMADDYIAIYRRLIDECDHHDGKQHRDPRGLLHPGDQHAAG
jgi:glycosyltransferase involved in cell wall biosynthesis